MSYLAIMEAVFFGELSPRAAAKAILAMTLLVWADSMLDRRNGGQK